MSSEADGNDTRGKAPSPYAWAQRRLELYRPRPTMPRDVREALQLAAAMLAPFAHWFLVENWLAWALTLPLVLLGSVGYLLYKGAQVGPGRGDR